MTVYDSLLQLIERAEQEEWYLGGDEQQARTEVIVTFGLILWPKECASFYASTVALGWRLNYVRFLIQDAQRQAAVEINQHTLKGAQQFLGRLPIKKVGQGIQSFAQLYPGYFDNLNEDLLPRALYEPSAPLAGSFFASRKEHTFERLLANVARDVHEAVRARRQPVP